MKSLCTQCFKSIDQAKPYVKLRRQSQPEYAALSEKLAMKMVAASLIRNDMDLSVGDDQEPSWWMTNSG
jgi:hypothetical protein